MKKIGVIAAIVIIAVVGISRSRSSIAPQNRDNQSGLPKESSAPQATTGAEAEPALTQLIQQVSEDKSESSAEQSSFQNRLEDIMAEMPTLSAQRTPEADADGHIHGSLPEELVEARILGQLRKAVFENPQHAVRSQIVYAGCAERADLSNAVRAVCFMRALELSLKVKNPQTIAALDVPIQIRNLAQKLISKGKL
ncbi:MAG: hypothetical protein K2P92_05060 [Bdellovibrionaceae bacterium]|nr:hypothetical protein [Pseudobdellovibrionaceae bacterium]